MPTKAEVKADLDAAIKQIHQDVDDLVQKGKDSAAALAAVTAKVDAGEDFSAELDELKGIHANFVAATQGLADTTAAAAAPTDTQPPADAGAPIPPPANP